MSVAAPGSVVAPGQLLRSWAVGSAATFSAGAGAHLGTDGNSIRASVLGRVAHSPHPARPGQHVVSVQYGKLTDVVPSLGDTVTCRVTHVTMRYAKCELLCIGARPIKETFTGLIRKQDVREMNIDDVEIFNSFRPSDIVRADVISRGNRSEFYLSTAKNHLGVVVGHSESGHTMVPVSWEEMVCPVTKVREPRKCAKRLTAPPASEPQAAAAAAK